MELAGIGILLAKAIAPVVISLVGYAATAAANWLRAQTNSKATSTALDVITEVTTTVVTRIQQSVVPRLKESLADGRLTSDEARALAKQAVEEILAILKQKGLAKAVQVLGLDPTALEALVAAKVEQEVYRLKHPAPAVLLPFGPGIKTAPIAGSPEALNYKS